MWWPAVVKSEWELSSEFPLRLDYGWSPRTYVNQRLQIQLELLMMSGMLLETCRAFSERWNNKFFYKGASCWLFLLSHAYFSHLKWLDMALLHFLHVLIDVVSTNSSSRWKWCIHWPLNGLPLWTNHHVWVTASSCVCQEGTQTNESWCTSNCRKRR